MVDLLTNLVDKSLLRGQSDLGENQRFRMLETIREYGLERLAESGEEPALRDAHAAWCLNLAQRAEPALHGQAQAEWLARLALEHDNFRGALAWVIAQGNGELAQRLAALLVPFWIRRGHFVEGRRWLEQALALNAGVPPTVRAKALVGLGRLAYRQGDYGASVFFEEALPLFRAAGDIAGIASSLGGLGMLIEDLGEHERASALEEEALALFRGLDDRPNVVRMLVSRGLAAYDLGDYARATGRLEEALALARSIGSEQSTAHALNNLALVAHAQGDYARAEALQAEVLAIWLRHGSMDGIAHCLENFAIYAAARNGTMRAARLFAAAEELRKRIGIPGRPGDREVRDRLIAEVSMGLGNEAFAHAWAEGEMMPLDVAITYALD